MLEELSEAYLIWRNDKCLFTWWEYVKVEFPCFFLAKSRQQACGNKKDFRELQRQFWSLQDLRQCIWDIREELET